MVEHRHPLSPQMNEKDDLGYSIAANVFTADEVASMRLQLGDVLGAGCRGMLRHPLVSRLACAQPLLSIAQSYLDGNPRPVRAIYFDKSPGQNWLVPWHQDLTIAVSPQMDIPDFGPWSEKNGSTHVQPPNSLLEQMITLRIHLDDADESNGALKVLPGSHLQGRLGASDIEAWRRDHQEVICRARSGDVMVMRPLLLHSSGRSSSDRHRRILHIEYAGFSLPHGLSWSEQA